MAASVDATTGRDAVTAGRGTAAGLSGLATLGIATAAAGGIARSIDEPVTGVMESNAVAAGGLPSIAAAATPLR